MFGFPFALPADFEDRSTYTFGLPRPDAAGDETPFRSNVVVVRTPKGEDALRDLVERLAESLREQAPNMVVVSDSETKVAGCKAIERHPVIARVVRDSEQSICDRAMEVASRGSEGLSLSPTVVPDESLNTHQRAMEVL